MTKTIRTCDACGADISDAVKFYKLDCKYWNAANKRFEPDFKSELCEACHKKVTRAGTAAALVYEKGEG